MAKKKYETIMSIKYESENWNQASKGNQNMIEYILSMFDMFDTEIECKLLREISGDVNE